MYSFTSNSTGNSDSSSVPRKGQRGINDDTTLKKKKNFIEHADRGDVFMSDWVKKNVAHQNIRH